MMSGGQTVVVYLDTGERCPPDMVEDVLRKWDGYIAPDGAFHATKPSGAWYWRGSAFAHEDWARERFGGDLAGYCSAKDRLVYGEGWISCAFDLMLTPSAVIVPDRRRLTEVQKLTLLRVYEARGLDLRRYFELLGESPDGGQG